MDSSTTFYWPVLLVSNAIALLLLYLSWKRPKAGLLGIFTILAWAGFANWMQTTTAFGQFPADANITFSIIDAGPAHHWFINHGTVAIRFVAVCQWIVALSLLVPGKSRKAGAISGIILLFFIAPIGFGSPFPFTFLIALALYALASKKESQVLKTTEAIHELNNDDYD